MRRVSFPRLFKRGRIGKLELRNRLIMSVLPTRFAEASKVSPQMLSFYRTRARGGVALIVVEGPCVDYPADSKGSYQLRLDEDQFLPGLRQLAEVLHQEGAKALMQLSHHGRKKEDGKKIKIVNSIRAEEIEDLIGKFAFAARRCQEVGFDGVEVQAGYGHLVFQFLSLLKNQRTDNYGGSLENRTRFLLEIVRAIREETRRDFVVQVKLAGDEFLPGGFGVEEAKEVAVWLEGIGVDSILVTGGAKETKPMTVPSYYKESGLLVPLATQIKESVKIPVIAMGKIKDPAFAEEILLQSKADFIGMSRPLLADPNFPRKALEGRVADIRGCISCNECSGKPKKGPRRQCTVNPAVGREQEFQALRNSRDSKSQANKERKEVWVIGGGPAGMQAAIIASKKGHKVKLFEKRSQLGGQFNLAPCAPHKEEVSEVNRYLIHRLQQLPVEVFVDREIIAEELVKAEPRPDTIFVATGSRRIIPPLPGVTEASVVEACQLWAGKAKTGRKVVVIGGGEVGCETALLLAERGCQVTVIEMLKEVLLDMNKLIKDDLLNLLKEKGVKIITKAQAASFTADKVVVRKNGDEEIIEAENIVTAVGGYPESELAEELKDRLEEVYIIGDCVKPGKVGDALRSAAWTALKV